MSSCLTVKGAEDVLNKQFAFELSTNRDTMYFIADTDKVCSNSKSPFSYLSALLELIQNAGSKHKTKLYLLLTWSIKNVLSWCGLYQSGRFTNQKVRNVL